MMIQAVNAGEFQGENVSYTISQQRKIEVAIHLFLKGAGQRGLTIGNFFPSARTNIKGHAKQKRLPAIRMAMMTSPRHQIQGKIPERFSGEI